MTIAAVRITALTEEDVRELAGLRTPPGAPGSGRARYAAAMHFFFRGMLDAETLEVYRVLALIDGEAPAALLAARGLPDPAG